MIKRLKHIETPRLIIRPVQLGDEVALNKAINDSLTLLQKWQPWAKDPSMEATRAFVQRGVFAWESGSIVNFPMVVIHKKDQNIIGASGFNDRSDPSKGWYEIGYWCAIDYQGQGLVTECANALTQYAFDALKASKAILCIQIENKKSLAVAKRLHFINEGIKVLDPVDCVSDQAAQHYLYAAPNPKQLPPLEVSWQHEAHGHEEAEMIAWAKQTLNITDNQAFASSKVVVKTPWSNVLEMNAGSDLVYLKQTPKDLFLEADIIQLLRSKCHITTIPEVMATNPEHHCFVMKKCGDMSLRDYFDGTMQLDILKQGLTTYKALQKATIPQVDALIALGVPDWRLDKFPARYEQLIADAPFLKEHGITAAQQKKLHHYKDLVKTLCDKLADYDMDACLNHSDFHDNNLLYNKKSKTTTIIDLGETAISHPFFSLTAYLWTTKNRYQADAKDWARLDQHAFDGWLTTDEQVAEVTEIINLLQPIYLIFTQKRFLDAIELPYHTKNPLSVKQHAKITQGFVWFINNMETE